jgi:hypothetical protein
LIHVEDDALVNAVILQGADHLEASAIADVRQPRVLVTAEVALENLPVLRAIEDRAPLLELANAIRGLFRVQLGHPPLVQVLPAAHRVGEVRLPRVAVVDVAHRSGHAAFGHHGVRFAEQRLADHSDVDAGSRGFDGGAKSRSTGANDEDIVLMRLELNHRAGVLRLWRIRECGSR